MRIAPRDFRPGRIVIRIGTLSRTRSPAANVVGWNCRQLSRASIWSSQEPFRWPSISVSRSRTSTTWRWSDSRDRKILDELIIQDLGKELFSLVEDEQPRNLLLNFTNVDFLSSAALGKLISLHKKVERAGGGAQAEQHQAGDLRRLQDHPLEREI